MNQETVKKLFTYKDGNLYWAMKPSYKINIGDLAGSLRSTGYVAVMIDGKYYKNHRLIFLWNYGFLPKYIDHINGNPADNRIENLRAASLSQNQFNRKKSSTSTTGCKNVFFNKKDKKWVVKIRVNGTRKHLGTFSNLELADLVATEARDLYHKEFANHG